MPEGKYKYLKEKNEGPWTQYDVTPTSPQFESRRILEGPRGNFMANDRLSFRDASSGVAELIHPDVDPNDITVIYFTIGDNEGNGYVQIYLSDYARMYPRGSSTTMVVKKLKYDDLCRFFLTPQQQQEEKKKEKFDPEAFKAAVYKDLRNLALPQEGTDIVDAMNAVPGLVTTINNAFWLESNTDAERERIVWSIMDIDREYDNISEGQDVVWIRDIQYAEKYRKYLESIRPQWLRDGVKRFFLARLPIEKQTWVQAVWARGRAAN